MAEFPNRVTWISLGNQVQVKGDLTRRVYRISLRPRYANPQDRDSSSFRHPGQSGLDLLSWTRKNRRELMTAILTLVRAWFAQGSPYPQRGVSFGSFEAWERIVGGIVEVAGLEGFLSNLKVWRSESDFDSQYWMGHLGWLREQFGTHPFRTSNVREKAMTDPQSYLAPPRLDDPSEKDYGKKLGEAYSRLRGRRYENRWIERVGSSHGHVSLWQVFELGDGPTEGNPNPAPTPGPVPLEEEPDVPTPADLQRVAEEFAERLKETEMPVKDDSEMSSGTVAGIVHGDGPGMLGEMNRALAEQGLDSNGDPQPVDEPVDVATFDLETGDAGDLYRTPGSEYIRIGAVAHDDQEVSSFGGPTVAGDVAAAFHGARTITGHNIMAFDLPALVRAGVTSMGQIHRMAADGRLFDALLVARYLDPPMARDKGVDAERKYDLGALGVRYELGEKLTDVSKGLAKKYGGWENIPIDDSEDGLAFKAYMIMDVELSRRLHARLLEELGGRLPDYLVREHRVAAIAAQISVNGFLVDQGLLTERVTEIQERKADAMSWLAENCDIPLNDAKGKPYVSPLASKVGKAALEAALQAAGVTSMWRTGSTKEIQVSAEHMYHLGREYHEIPQVVAIVKQVYRIVSARTVYETAYNSMCPDGRVHPKIGFEQATGRWSVTKPGLTVFGKRGGRHVERDVFLPDPGEVLLSFDLSQVDMRAVAGLSQDQAYIQMLHHDDPHAELAMALFNDVKYREQAKAIGHGWNYGESLRRISEENEIEPALVRQFDTSMRERFPRLVEWRDQVRAIAESGQLLDNGFGRLMRPDPQRAHTQGPALMGQGGARDLMMEGMLRLPAETLPMLRAQIHDEIVLSAPIDQVEDVSRTVIDALSFKWKGVPILADVSNPGSSWGMCYVKS